MYKKADMVKIRMLLKSLQLKQDRQYTYNVTLRCVCATIVAEGNQYYI